MVHVNYRIESENRQKKARQTKKKKKKTTRLEKNVQESSLKHARRTTTS